MYIRREQVASRLVRKACRRERGTLDHAEPAPGAVPAFRDLNARRTAREDSNPPTKHARVSVFARRHTSHPGDRSGGRIARGSAIPSSAVKDIVAFHLAILCRHRSKDSTTTTHETGPRPRRDLRRERNRLYQGDGVKTGSVARYRPTAARQKNRHSRAQDPFHLSAGPVNPSEPIPLPPFIGRSVGASSRRSSRGP